MSYINEFSHPTTRALRAPQWAPSSGTTGIEEMPAASSCRPVAIATGGSSLLRNLQHQGSDVLKLAARQDALDRAQQCAALLAVFPSEKSSLVPQEAIHALTEELEHAGNQLPRRFTEPAALFNASANAVDELGNASRSSSNQDFFEEIFALLDRLDKEWLSRFGDILSNYVGFFNKLTDAMSLLSKAIVDHDEKGNLKVNFDALRNALEDLISVVENGPGLGGDFKTRAEAEEFLKDLGLEGLVVKPKFGGGFELAVDPKMIRDLSTLFEKKGEQPMNPAAHAAIISAKDSLMERFNHINRVLPDKYQRQLQVWDTLVKALSGTIDSMAEANRLIAQNIG